MPLNRHYVWELENLTFHLCCGDLFEIPVEAIVNSDQTDFILAWNRSTISGQIRHRFGPAIQEELDSLNPGPVPEPPVVLATKGGSQFSKIYHAGFHAPWDWFSPDDDQAEYVNTIARCIRIILDSLDKDSIKSVAFPLIGCGVFRLSPELLACQFMHELLGANANMKPDPRKEVWLVVNEEEIFSRLIQPIVQAVIDFNPVAQHVRPADLGIPFLDETLNYILRTRHTIMAAWLATRFCELLLEYMLAHLAKHAAPPKTPEEIIGNFTFRLTFGATLNYALSLAQNNSLSGWQSFFGKRILEERTRAHRINRDRNDIAHGRQARNLPDIWQDIEKLIARETWEEMKKSEGPPEWNDLFPWIENEQGEAGVLESADSARLNYVVPPSGRCFSRPRLS